jgi:RNA polymerase sigma-70 factor (sigma-E family)
MSITVGALTGLPSWAREGTDQRMGVSVAIDRAPTFDELFRRRYEPMVRVAFLLVGSRAEAEDVVQDAFARIEMRWARLENPEGYLHRCVVNRSNDVLRRRRIERRFLLLRRDESSELQADELGDALAALPPKRRAAVVLKYYAGLKEQEIADALGVRPGTVKSMVHRALAELREVIER